VPVKYKRGLVAAAVIFVFLGLWAFWWEPASLTVVHQTISLRAWHAEHSGLRIAVMSDLHVGAPFRDLENLKTVVAAANGEGADLILLLGDFVQGATGGRFVAPEPIAEILGGLKAPLGVVAVLGNHDWWYDGERVRRALAVNGLQVLENENLPVTRGGKSFWLSGLGDLWTRGNHLVSTLQRIHDDEPIIVMMHNPDLFPDMPPRVSLTLAGHTHGGQVDLPVVGRLVVPSMFGQRYAYGLVNEDGKPIFVTGGIGTSILPVRFRVPPEIVVLEIVRE